MKEVDVKLKELKELMDKEDEQSEARRMEIALWIRENKTEEVEQVFRAFMDEGLTEIEIEIEDIRRQFNDEDYKLLPLAYIAKHYFGKSHAWLSQRINGTKVRGQVYTLNNEQKEIFNKALKDISKKIGSFHIA